MKKSNIKTIIICLVLFYSVCIILLFLFLNFKNNDAISTFENMIKTSGLIKSKYGNIKKIRFKNPFNYGKSVNDEYIMKVKITNDKNETYTIEVIQGKSTNSIVGFIIDGKRFDEYESFNLSDYQDKINNNIKDINIGEFSNYQELFEKVKNLTINLYGDNNYLVYQIYYDKNKLTYLVEIYSKEKSIAFLIKTNGDVLASFII